jgi:hypothetical protein
MVYAWVGDGLNSRFNDLDNVTVFLSHEVGEAMTDPTGNGITVTKGANWNGSGNEIGDFEPDERYTYRVSGELTQALWDYNDQAFVVSDGTSQNFNITPVWSNGQYVGNKLTLNGDQFGYGYNDTITIGENGSGGVWVDMNGEIASFDPGQITSIEVDGGQGNDTINVESTLPGVSVTVNLGGGTDTVNISPSAQTLDNIQGQVNVNGGSGYDTLNINDQHSIGFADIYLVSSFGVTRGYTAGVYYSYIDAVNLNGGPGGDTYNVYGTEDYFATTINLGGGANTVNVAGTGNGTLNIIGNGGSGHDVVNLGYSYNTVQNINGTVNIENPPSYNTIHVDDSADPFTRTATLTTFTPTATLIRGVPSPAWPPALSTTNTRTPRA